MATKISKVNAERLKKLGISAKTEEEAKKILLDRLEKAGIPGMDEETIDNLIDIVGSFAELEGEAEEEAAPAPKPKKAAPKKAAPAKKAEKAAEETAAEATAEDQDKVVIDQIRAMSLDEMLETAAEAGYPEDEFKKFKKNPKLMAAYLVKKYKAAVTSEE